MEFPHLLQVKLHRSKCGYCGMGMKWPHLLVKLTTTIIALYLCNSGSLVIKLILMTFHQLSGIGKGCRDIGDVDLIIEVP